MMQKAPEKSHRKGITLAGVLKIFSDDATAEAWIAEGRWPDGPYCPYCGTFNVQSNIKHKTMTHRCRKCPGKQMFSLKTGTVMQGSNLGYRAWAVATYLMTTNLKGISSMKLHRELGITQRSAWHLAHRLRQAFDTGNVVFTGPIEVDETYMGGKERNKHSIKKMKAGCGTVGKVAVIRAKDRQTNTVKARVVVSTNKASLQGFVRAHAKSGAQVFTDDHAAYEDMPVRESQCWRVCRRHRPYERHRVVLGNAKTGAQGRVPSDEPEAPPAVRHGVCRPPQLQATRHRGANARYGARHEG